MKKQTLQKMRTTMLTLVLVLLCAAPASAANVKTTVEQVTGTVTLTDDVDYIVSSATPFTNSGVVNITNTDHAVLILANVKPSAAIRLLASHVKVNGAKAVNNTNCQVKLYNLGCIIMPYANDIKPLTVYSEQNFQGEAVNDFGLEHTGGYMNTLTAEKLNNRIRSFKLKRGYMVTFANRAGGRGYSRCFIAADADLEMGVLPGVLDNSISSYRVFKWYDAGKKQLANSAGDAAALSALNVQSTYDWGQGNSSLAPNIEWVPNHIYEDWPSSSAIGSTTQSPHTKNNNEPRNSADDHPQDLETILGNWENMMRTGLRLCSPASWDGSDYWNATGFLADFIDSIDARGWRCDIIDLHCYWPESNFGNIANWANKYKRPVWISEWCWGASWNSNGAFASGVNETQVRDALERICTGLNNADYVERYYYWNGERDPSRLYKNGKLTPAGEMYAALDGGLAYNGKFDYAPKVPEQKDPHDLVVDFDKNAHSAKLTWYDPNGELNVSSVVERRKSASANWEVLASLTLKETAGKCTFEDGEATNGCQYRIHIVDANCKDRYSNIVTAASSDLGAGDSVELDGVTKYIGGNIFVNGNFDMGCYGWLSGTNEPLGQPWFQVVPVGGYGNGPYLQTYGNGTANTVSAIRTAFDIKPNTDYYYTGSVCNTINTFSQLCFTEDGTSSKGNIFSLQNTTSNWLTQFKTFNSGSYSKVLVSFRMLGSKTQVDNLLLAQLFDTEEEAIADGVEKARLKAEAFMAYNTLYAEINHFLSLDLASITGTDQTALFAIERAVSQAIQAYTIMPKLQALYERAAALLALNLTGSDELKNVISKSGGPTPSFIISQYAAIQAAIDDYLPLTTATKQPTQPKFASATGWTTKCGTYTGGDQCTNSQDGITFWNAWWSGINASEGTAKTMEVKQEVKGLSHGLYTLECKSSTEHYCLSDQHGYITSGDQTAVTPALTADYFDLPTVAAADRWQTLTSAPVYVDENGSATIGFIGSKAGAIDNAWHELGNSKSNGDKREGWWCATDFVLKHTPLYRATVVPGQWNVVCLPYNATPGVGVTLYQIAGVSDDYTYLCVEPVDKAMAGVPVIYKSEGEVATFMEQGKSVAATSDAPGNLRGWLKTTLHVPADYYYLEEGEWKKCTQTFSERPYIGNFGAAIRPFTDSNATAVTIYKGWEGLTIPINGITEEEIEFNNANAQVVVVGGNEGDVNVDGKVDVADIASVITFMAGNNNAVTLEQADVNKDGKVDVADIAAIITIMAK
ncbi:MAG: hypothetical protein J6Z14_04240 [Prevotella sp.]|nr:hypothetical protein [Prevotella sp.]